MPHVTVHFDPKQVDQKVIDKLKREVHIATAIALSARETRKLKHLELNEDIATLPDEIYVRQQASHETDVNPAPIEIVVEAGRSKRRDPDLVSRIIEAKVKGSELIPSHLLGEGQSCIWVKFCEENGFRFIRK